MVKLLINVYLILERKKIGDWWNASGKVMLGVDHAR